MMSVRANAFSTSKISAVDHPNSSAPFIAVIGPSNDHRYTLGGEVSKVTKISAVIITFNEAKNIADCLKSLEFCDEYIVVDAGSHDETVRIAEQLGARVVHNDWMGFGPQKNFALSLAQNEWVLSVDADERVTKSLASEILRAVEASSADGYLIPRRSSFCGRSMTYSGWSPNYVLRLFRRSQARFSDHLVHERVICNGKITRLREYILHYPVWRLEDALRRMDQYSTLSARAIENSNRRVSFTTGIIHGLWTFVRTYVLQRGFLDGREGFLLAVANAEGTYYRYMKAWLLRRRMSQPLIDDVRLSKDTPSLRVLDSK